MLRVREKLGLAHFSQSWATYNLVTLTISRNTSPGGGGGGGGGGEKESRATYKLVTLTISRNTSPWREVSRFLEMSL